MSLAPTEGHDGFIWATRGRTWGFRFLRTGGFEDPLDVYDTVFSELDDQAEAWARVDDKLALRFPDPAGRRDAAGRVIPHDFVLFGPWVHRINSLEHGSRLIWERVADEFEDVWDKAEPPSAIE